MFYSRVYLLVRLPFLSCCPGLPLLRAVFVFFFVQGALQCHWLRPPVSLQELSLPLSALQLCGPHRADL